MYYTPIMTFWFLSILFSAFNVLLCPSLQMSCSKASLLSPYSTASFDRRWYLWNIKSVTISFYKRKVDIRKYQKGTVIQSILVWASLSIVSSQLCSSRFSHPLPACNADNLICCKNTTDANDGSNCEEPQNRACYLRIGIHDWFEQILVGLGRLWSSYVWNRECLCDGTWEW